MATCDIDKAEGKRVAMATLSALVIDGGVRELLRGRAPGRIVRGAEAAVSAEPESR